MQLLSFTPNVMCTNMTRAAAVVEQYDVFFAEEQAACHHRSFGPADKKQSPDWDFVIVFSDKAYGLTVNTKGLTDNFQFNQV